MAKIVGGRGYEVTREFLRLESHYLFAHHFCLVRRPNEKGYVENLLGYALGDCLTATADNTTAATGGVLASKGLDATIEAAPADDPV